VSYYQEGHNRTVDKNVGVFKFLKPFILLSSLLHRTYPTKSDICIGFQSLSTGFRSDISDPGQTYLRPGRVSVPCDIYKPNKVNS
jgi:hypothetical protein